MQKKLGIIDLGSNSVRLVIYEIYKNGAFRLMDDISENVRLSEGSRDNLLSEESMSRAMKALCLFKKLSSAYGIPAKDVVAVATAAVRNAVNGDTFLSEVRLHTGLVFQTLTGEEEALSDFEAVRHTLDVSDGILIDIGGGSTEIVKFAHGEPLGWISIPLGAVNTTEQFFNGGNVTKNRREQFFRHVSEHLQPLEWLKNMTQTRMIGIGGTLRNLAKIHRRHCAYPLDMTHNYSVSVSEAQTLTDRILALSPEERASVDGLSDKRRDIMAGGLALFEAICRFTDTQQIIFSGSGLREGILIQQLKNHFPGLAFGDMLELSTENAMTIYNVRSEHAWHVCTLGLSLFDQLTGLHGLSYQERRLLKAASLLHDVGISISYYDHHRHAFYILMNSRLFGLSHRELVLVAAIAANHRSERFKDDWEKQYKALLSHSDLKMYKKLAVFLRIAESLDRSESGVVKSVECRIVNQQVILKTLRRDDAELEMNQAKQQCENFRKLFGKPLIIE